MSDPRPEKKAFEQAVADCVVKHIPGVIVHGTPDAPDVDLLHQGGFHIGMEIG